MVSQSPQRGEYGTFQVFFSFMEERAVVIQCNVSLAVIQPSIFPRNSTTEH